MNIIIFTIAVTGILLLIHNLAKRFDRGTQTEALQDEARPFVVESPLLLAERDSWLTLQPETDAKPSENVTSSLPPATDQSRCPACGAKITANDERCPACEIAFVTDGSSLITDSLQKWTTRTAGPADGICLPPTQFRE